MQVLTLTTHILFGVALLVTAIFGILTAIISFSYRRRFKSFQRRRLIYILTYTLLAIWSLSIWAFSMFGVFPWWTCIFFPLTIAVLLGFQYRFWIVASEPRPIFTLLAMLSVLILLGFWYWATARICVAYMPLYLSFQGASLFAQDPCKNNICRLYFTAWENTSSQVIVNFHSSEELLDPRVRYWPASESDGESNARVQKAEHLVDRGTIKRHVYLGYLEGLQPDTLYSVSVSGGTRNDANKFERGPRKFRTTPQRGTNDKPVVVASGGDVGLQPEALEIIKQVLSKAPAVVLIGGDLAYANGYPSCYSRWDQWLDAWDKARVYAADEQLPQFLTAIGNHEAGSFKSRPAYCAWYTIYMPHSRPKDLQTLVDATVPTYRTHIVGHAYIFALDSYVLTQAGGSQHAWLVDSLAAINDATHVWKFALYHAPIYPGCRAPEPFVPQMKQLWATAFDRYGLHLALENHNHCYKRTKPIAGDKVASHGVIYAGDGSMGASTRNVPQPPDYIEKYASKYFFHLMRIGGDTTNVQAIDNHGETFDTFNVNFSRDY